jgi:glycerophosphoryl diester phosphodiesterase
VAEVAAAQLGQLDAGSWFAPEFAGERIPTLASTLALVRGRAMINIEIKAGGTARARSALLEAVIDVVREAGAERTTLLSSFDHGLISVAQYRAPAIARAVIASPMDIRRALPRAREVRAEAVVISKRQLRASFVEEAKRRELAVLVFTVDRPRDLLRSARAGVTGVFTNDVAGSLQLLERNREKPDRGVRNRTIAN